ncbi:prepilin peptidase [Falsihalocynthiibacter sp. S25ZX9]|uniref:prepilin peptidase n=1 Tax=Falsihalocynthiibacter sp. S25ZX9 TaxID=3240870 RepID=UPI0035103471
MDLALSASAAKVFLPFVLPICVWVMFSDLKYMKIRNTAVLALVAIYAVIGFFALPLDVYFSGWMQGLVMLVVGFVAASIGLVGAGDAKVFAAISPFVARADIPKFTILLATCLLVGFVAHRLVRASPLAKKLAPEWESWHRKKEFPAGISLGFLLALYLILAAFFNV